MPYPATFACLPGILGLVNQHILPQQPIDRFRYMAYQVQRAQHLVEASLKTRRCP